MSQLTNVYIPQDLEEFFPTIGVNFSEWREYLRNEYLVYRDRVCWCDVPFRNDFHQHEGLYSRRDVMGWKRELRVLIHTPYNNILTCPDCNLGLSGKSPPSREDVFYKHFEIYGNDLIKWCKSLPFKVNPLRGILEQF